MYFHGKHSKETEITLLVTKIFVGILEKAKEEINFLKCDSVESW